MVGFDPPVKFRGEIGQSLSECFRFTRNPSDILLSGARLLSELVECVYRNK